MKVVCLRLDLYLLLSRGDSFTGGLLVPEGIIRPVVIVLALTWWIYFFLINVQVLNNAILKLRFTAVVYRKQQSVWVSFWLLFPKTRIFGSPIFWLRVYVQFIHRNVKKLGDTCIDFQRNTTQRTWHYLPHFLTFTSNLKPMVNFLRDFMTRDDFNFAIINIEHLDSNISTVHITKDGIGNVRLWLKVENRYPIKMSLCGI